jgi:anti-sigma-K factor RskA
MNYLQPERLDRLAREYVLGTLTGRARRRFERVLSQSAAAMQAVREWQERLATLAAGVPPLQPRPTVWLALQQRLAPQASRGAQPPSEGWMAWLWRWLGGKTLAGAVAGVLMCTAIVQTQPGLLGLEPQVDAVPASYVGLLTNAAGKPAVVASSRRHGRQLSVRLLQPLPMAAGQVAQLWALPDNGAPAFPVGVLPPTGTGKITLADVSETLFFNVSRLAVSIQAEPAKPGDAPPANFVLTGHCVKAW